MAAIETVYVKIEQLVSVHKKDIHLADLADLWSEDKLLLAKCKTLPVCRILGDGHQRQIMTMLDITRKLQQAYPGISVENMGETEFIIDYHPKKHYSLLWQWVKTALVCGIVFFGAAFAIVAFNYDAGVSMVLKNIYQKITGTESDGFTILEVTYSFGLTLGILLFYNHFSPKKVNLDPTPLEVEMRMYEKNINDAVLMNLSREEAVQDKE